MLAAAAAVALACVAAPAQAEPASPRACIDAATQGQKLRDAGRLLAARTAFLACAAEGCPETIRLDCAGWVTRVDAATPRVVFGAREANGHDLLHARVFANDTLVATELAGREQALDPGPYRFRFEKEDGTRITVDAVLRAGDVARGIVATFPGPDASSPVAAGPPAAPAQDTTPRARSVALVVLGGGALVAAGTFLVFALRAGGETDDLRASCAPACTSNDTRSLRTDLVVADVAGIAALVLGAAFAGVAVFAPPTLIGARANQPPRFDLPRIVWK